MYTIPAIYFRPILLPSAVHVYADENNLALNGGNPENPFQ